MSEAVDVCRYHILEHRIHEFILPTTTREGVDQMFIHFRAIVENTPSDQDIRVLIDTSAHHNGQPFMSIAANLQALLRAFPDRTFYHRTRVALVNRNLFSPMVQSFVKMLNVGIEIHHFDPNQREAAMAWLVETSNLQRSARHTS